jgi:hypothetical protein
MDFISEILSANIKIDFVIISLVIAGGYFQKLYWITEKPAQAIKTLIVSTVFSLIYLALTMDVSSVASVRNDLLGGFVSYALATSFYELIVKHVVDIIVKFFDRKIKPNA